MALSHVVLHIALCNSALRLKTQTAMQLHVNVVDRINRNIVDQDFRVVRENGNDANVAFDMPWGVYRASVGLKARKITCSAVQYFAVAMDHNRNLNLSLAERPSMPIVPALVYGAAPFAFAYVQPTVVLFDRNVKCGAAVGDPLSAAIDSQNDSDGYYASITPTRDLIQHQPVVVAVRLTDSRGNYHYVKVPTNFMTFSASWPSAGTLNANENLIDYVADKPEDTLLCPKFYETTSH